MENKSIISGSSKSPLSRQEWVWLGLIVVGAVAFYLPFLARQFQGDDWLWLYNAKSALADPSIIVGRPMYGYFRPLNMLIVMGFSQLFGVNATAFSLVSISLHALNSSLVWVVLRRFGVELRIRNIAAFFFALYFLNCSAIEWISVGHDLWVTMLCLLVVLKTIQAGESPSKALFVQIWLMAVAATLIKESGFVSIGLFFAVLLLNGKSPLEKQYRWFSVSFAVSFAAYLVGYAMTRTIIDREVSVGLTTLSNLWYFLAFLAFPVSERIVSQIPDALYGVLKVVRIAVIVAFPVIAFHLWRRSGSAVKVFLVWSVMFVSTFAIMEWGVSLFSLYPARSVGRFMYSPVLGLAVCVAWLWVREVESRIRVLRTTIGVILIALLFIAVNFLAVRAASRLYFANQEQVANIREDISSLRSAIQHSDSLAIFTENIDQTRDAIGSEAHLRAIIFMDINHRVAISLNEVSNPFESALSENAATLNLTWDSENRRLVLPQEF